MIKVFTTYVYQEDEGQDFKDEISEILNDENDIQEEFSEIEGVDSDNLSDEEIGNFVRDQYLKDSTVTLVIGSINCKTRAYIDWVIYSSMMNNSPQGQSGIVLIDTKNRTNLSKVLPYDRNTNPQEENLRYVLFSQKSRLSKRITENINSSSWIEVLNIDTIRDNPEILGQSIKYVNEKRLEQNYSLNSPLMRDDGIWSYF